VSALDQMEQPCEGTHPGSPTDDALFDYAAGRMHPDAAEFVAAHLEGCARCAARHARVIEVRLALEAPPVGPFDPQRAVSAVKRRLATPRRARPWALALGVTAALVVGALGGWLAFAPPRDAGPAWAIVSATGAARVGDGALGPVLPVGEALRVAAGGRVLATWGEARVLVDGGAGEAVVRLDHTRGGRRRLVLERGRVILDVDPLPAGTTLAVATTEGDVQVKGTVFLVERDGAGTGVAVSRGRVAVRLRGQAGEVALDVAAGQRILPGASTLVALDGQTRTALDALGATGSHASTETKAEVATPTGATRSAHPAMQPAAPSKPEPRQPKATASLSTEARPREAPVRVASVREPAAPSAREPVAEPRREVVADSDRRPIPNGPTAEVLQAARAALAAGDHRYAIRIAEALRRRTLSPVESVRVLVVLGQAERAALRPELAVLAFSDAASVAGAPAVESEQACYLLAQTLARDVGDAPRAVAAWRRAAERFPRGLLAPEVAFRLGESLLEAGDARGGVAQLDRYLAEHPGAPHADEAHLLAAAALRDRLGDCAGAIQHFAAVAANGRRGPRAETALIGQARCLQGLGRKDEARRAFEQYLKLAPDGRHADEARRFSSNAN
jgi:ferric-dicitrate binding protein FerR (iron transport regulator)/TolA-binding protein